MGIGLKNRLAVGATPVPDVFIDTYMAGASGEYVKVYLYLLRHQQEEVSIGQIADALNHTEADVQRALAYWQRAGVLGTEAVSYTHLFGKFPECLFDRLRTGVPLYPQYVIIVSFLCHRLSPP